MADTELLFLSDTFQFEIQAQITFTKQDDEGNYLVTDKTIFYPGGGGQEPDKGFIVPENGEAFPILKASLIHQQVRHYYEYKENDPAWKGPVTIEIDKNHRLQNARLHTGGHLLASIVYEELKWPLVPVKGFHYQQGAYVEFDPKEDITAIDEGVLTNALQEGIGKQLAVTARIVHSDSELFARAFKPDGFITPEGKPLRLVKIGEYLAYPCGGTHLHHTGELNFLKIRHIKHKKGKVRISYEAG